MAVEKYLKSNTRKGSVQKYLNPSKELHLEQIARTNNVEIPDDTPKLSFLRRLTAGLSALETGNALYKGVEDRSVISGIKQYGKDAFQGLRSAVTGKDRGQNDKKTYKDVLDKAGVQNKFVRGIAGFVGDVALDPSTYYGGAIAKGVGKTLSKGGGATLKGLGKASPKAEQGIRMVGEGIKDAAGKAFVFGYGVPKGLRTKVLQVQSKREMAREGIVDSNVRRLANPLSQTQQTEVASKLLEGKRGEFYTGDKQVARTVASSSDPLVQQTIEQQIARSKKFAKQASISDPFETYFPSLSKERLSKFHEATTKFKVGSEGYKKEFKDELTDDDILKNLPEAFARRESQIVDDNIVRSELKSIVRQFGKPLTAFKSPEEATRAGYSLVKEKGQFGKDVGYLKEVDKNFIDNVFTSKEFKTIDELARRIGFDAFTSLFKRSVTGLFAPFHARNWVSGHIQNFEVLGPKALSPKNIAIGHKIAHSIISNKATSGTVEVAGQQIPLARVLAPFKQRFATSSRYISDIGQDIQRTTTRATGFKGGAKEVLRTAGLGADTPHFRAARKVGNFIETQQKATAYITALRDGKSVKDALDLAERAGFDYRALTGFESKILRRIIPFYSFTRKNLELQARTLAEHPQRIGGILKAGRSLSEVDTSKLEDYAQEQFAIQTGTSDTGEPEIAVGAGTPVEQLSQILGGNSVRKVGAMLNPLFKFPAERSMNKDFFRDRPLKGGINQVDEAREYAKAPQFIKDWLELKEVKKRDFKTGKEKISYIADPHKLHLLRNLPTSRGAVYISAIFAPETSTPSKLWNAITGIKPRPQDLETIQYWKDEKRKTELEDLLINAGILKRYENVYRPKN